MRLGAMSGGEPWVLDVQEFETKVRELWRVLLVEPRNRAGSDVESCVGGVVAEKPCEFVREPADTTTDFEHVRRWLKPVVLQQGELFDVALTAVVPTHRVNGRIPLWQLASV